MQRHDWLGSYRDVAATTRDLEEMVRSGRFRADLYHRLSVCTVAVPPLRDMGDDRLLLLRHFRQRYAEQSLYLPFSLSEQAARLWANYTFPGNVRELRNIVIRLTAKYPGQTVSYGALEAELDLQDTASAPDDSLQPHPVSPLEHNTLLTAATVRLQQGESFSLDRLLAATERSYIEAALHLAHGNVSQAARLLGINRTTLYNRMESFAREP